MASNIKLIENILKEFEGNGKHIILLAELQSRLMITSTPVNIVELKKMILRLKWLFAFIDNDLICVYITLKACTSYNSRGCPLGNDCPDLHICEKQLKSADGCRNSCRLLHWFDTAEIKRKLIEDRFDYKTLMKFYQTFYESNLPAKAEAGAAYDSDNESVKSNEENIAIDKRRVMVKYSETFAKKHNKKYLFNLFARRDKTGGGYIEDFEYKPNEQHAIITFQKKRTVERLLNKQEKRDVHCDGFMFTVTRVNEKQSTSDYVSSKSKKLSTETMSSSTSTAVDQKISKNLSSNQKVEESYHKSKIRKRSRETNLNNSLNQQDESELGAIYGYDGDKSPTDKKWRTQRPTNYLDSSSQFDQNTVSLQVRLQMAVYKLHTALIDKLVRYMKVKFELKLCFVNEKESEVHFMGPLANVKRAAQVFTMCVPTENSRIRTRPVSSINFNILKAKHLDEILQDALKTVELVFDVRVGKFEQREEPGIFVSYFHNIAEIDSREDTVYDRIQSAITSTINYKEIDITAYTGLFNSPAWIDFRDENFPERIARNNFEIITNPIVNKSVIMLLIGKKTCVRKVNDLIEDFIAQNIPQQYHEIKLDCDKIKFLRNVLRNDLQHFEEVLEINFWFGSTSLIVENCSQENLKKIKSHIAMQLRQKCSKTYYMDALPGIESILKDMQFGTDLSGLEIELETVIIPEIRKTLVSSNNETKLSVGVNESIINLETGNIIKSEVDGIVNLISWQPKIDQGVLAQAVFQAAGPNVLNEVMWNGDGQDLVVTTAGDLKPIRCIIHSRLANFVSNVQATQDIRALIKNCLDVAIVYELDSIAFPTIGLGKKNYPLELVSSVMINTVSEFLTKNKNVKLTVCILIFEPKFLQAFRNEIEQKNLPKLQEATSVPFENENLVIQIESKNSSNCDLAAKRIKNLLSQKYKQSEIINDLLENPRF